MFSAITSSPCFDTSLRSPIISIQRDGTACRAAHCSLTSMAGACTRSHPLLTHPSLRPGLPAALRGWMGLGQSEGHFSVKRALSQLAYEPPQRCSMNGSSAAALVRARYAPTGR
jgi:hypothetical protein